MRDQLRGALRQLNDPTTVTHGIVSTALPALLTLIEPRGLHGGRRVAYRVGIGALAGWLTWVSLRAEPEGEISEQAAAGVGVGVAVTSAALAVPFEKMDAGVADRLERMGVRRPRVALAVFSAAASIASWGLSRRQARDAART